MRKTLRKAVVAAVLTIAAVGGGTAPAGAAQYWTTVSAGGGTFMYQATSLTNDCRYIHPSRWHRCTVENWGGVKRSLDRGPSVWASQTQTASFGGNRAYWFRY